jgi:hypothetical protein
MSTAYSPDDWVTATVCTWPHEAHVLRTLIEEHDIDAVVADEHMAQGLGSIAFGGVRVMVRLVDLEKAQMVLEAS